MFGAHIAFGGARESSRQHGRKAEKVVAWPISARLRLQSSLTAKHDFPALSRRVHRIPPPSLSPRRATHSVRWQQGYK